MSAHHIVGAYLHEAPPAKAVATLKRLARSKLLWERRIAMVATWHSIQQGSAEPALTIAEMLLKDEHDLMHKATGWMLREVGNRYAIEHFPLNQRKTYLK